MNSFFLIGLLVLQTHAVSVSAISGPEISGNGSIHAVCRDHESPGPAADSSGSRYPLVFATFAESPEQLFHARILCESIRTFGGRDRNAPVWVYIPEALYDSADSSLQKLAELNAEIRTSRTPDSALWFYFSQKVFAAKHAEFRARDRAEILAWIDEDTIFLQEPKAFHLPGEIVLAYRPVMHKNIGTLWEDPPDLFWSRVFHLLSIQEKTLFPMVTPADGDTIRPYFNAGLLIVRPERGILHRWVEVFQVLYQDSLLAGLCRQDVKKRIFIHQAALTGAILKTAFTVEMMELTPDYNYPLFFQAMYGAGQSFFDLRHVVTFRYDVFFRNPVSGWTDKLIAPPHVKGWIIRRLGNIR
jgi:hypothetical protein